MTDAPMTQTPAPETSAPKAAFAIEGVPVQTPARIAWGLGIGDLAFGVLGLLALLVAALGAPGAVVLGLGVVLAVLVALGVRADVAQPLPPAGLGGLGRLLVVAAALLLVAGEPVAFDTDLGFSVSTVQTDETGAFSAPFTGVPAGDYGTTALQVLADGTSSVLDEHFGALGGWVASTLVRLGDLRFAFLPADDTTSD